MVVVSRRGMDNEMKKLGLHKKQRLAIARVNRAMDALNEAGIKLCGMDEQLHWATDDACERHEHYADYNPVANAVQADDEESGVINSVCYQESGGW